MDANVRSTPDGTNPAPVALELRFPSQDGDVASLSRLLAAVARD